MTNDALVVIGIAGGIFSFGMVVAANTFYTKIGTYHPFSILGKGGGETSEPLYLKFFKLWLYNFILAISVAGLVLVYTAFPVGSANLIGISEGKALIIASIVMNFSIRIGSLSKITAGKLFERAISFGYSFVLSIYFLSFFAVGAYLLRNQFSTNQIVIPAIDGGDLVSIIGIIIVGPFISTLISEIVLIITGVDEEHKDDYSKEDTLV
jgi:hypothetical protein